MIFEPNQDQTAILDSLQRLCAPFQTVTTSQVIKRSIYALELHAALMDSGFLDIGVADPEAAISSALVVAEVAKLPVTVEVAATALIRPAICAGVATPVALVWGSATKPARFLSKAKTVLIVSDDDVRLLSTSPDDVVEVESIYGYPMGKLTPTAVAKAASVGPSVRPTLDNWWRIGIALEIYGALDSALALTVKHVTDRKQFGRPLGSFQAIQHRLAMDATTIQACRWLAIKAAHSGSAADAAMAAGYAQDAVKTVTYDVHQFSGAMGLALEYPLHLFTYRAKLLQSDLGGSHRQFTAVADDIWPQKNSSMQSTVAQGPIGNRRVG
jgi:hypothetical protein